jgi:NAD-dependent dihydropyrimidine dehydrogenase PreA subunit
MMKYLQNVVTLKYDPEKCTGCKSCLEVCPRGVFGFSDEKAYIIDQDLCIECGACENNCEFEALKVASGVGCATAHINSMITGNEPDCGCSNENPDTKACC